MPIDDPISALEALDRSDERQQPAFSRFGKQFLAVVKMLAPPGTEFAVGSLELAMDWLNSRAESNRQEFVKVLGDELKHCATQIQRVINENEAQRQFVENELPGLTLDALRRAEQCRAKERVARLARILSHAVSAGARDGADSIEDMMAIAGRLAESDLVILRHATLEYRAEISAHPRGKLNAR